MPVCRERCARTILQRALSRGAAYFGVVGKSQTADSSGDCGGVERGPLMSPSAVVREGATVASGNLGVREMRVSLALAFLLTLSPPAASVASAQTQQKGTAPSKASAFSEQNEREKVNGNLLMLLAGTLGGPWIQMAQDVAVTVSDGDNLRILPLAGGGAKSNLRDVLLARGVDLGITGSTSSTTPRRRASSDRASNAGLPISRP
jgi:hypothetical protein